MAPSTRVISPSSRIGAHSGKEAGMTTKQRPLMDEGRRCAISLSYLPHLLTAQAFIPPTERVEAAGFHFQGEQ
jgi:hypothetical protein